MKKINTLITVIFLSSCLFSIEKTDIAIIPMPTTIVKGDGFFSFNQDTKIYLSSNMTGLKVSSKFLCELFGQSSGIELVETKIKPLKNYVGLIIDNNLDDNYYELSINNNRVVIRANSPQSIFWGIQSLRQILPAEIESPIPLCQTELKVPSVEITDFPQFNYRGLMLDVGRHFYPVDQIKKIIDLMALYKLNKFHWHLTDDQGWRIEIKKYPLLTEVGSWRKETVIGKYPVGTKERDRKYDCTPHYGFYTQDEIKDVINYAQERFITVIPEIEMPGHATAALAAYPEYGCTGGPYLVSSKFGVHNDVFCPKDTTFQFLEDVLTEVADLFPSEYIHIGGDECPKIRWKNCVHCQRLIEKEDLVDEKELQSYFIKRISRFLNNKGKSIIGWDEILEGGLAPGATVMSWRGTEGGITAAKSGHDVIMSPRQYCYFDYYQSKDKSEPFAIGGFVPVEKVYSYNPIPEELPVELSKHIIGVQANVWTEFIATFDKVQYMLLPRMLAISEVQWTAHEKKDYTNFLDRTKLHKKRLDIMGLNYANHIFM
ncbi:MAG: beta-N-acetylhexosaminidase [Parabacteroides sp.]|nr:beta-N-acetylhexosaminidase [Parabacteroides sp.]